MIVNLALKGASPNDLAELRRLLVSNGLIDRRSVTAQKYAEPGKMEVGIDTVQFALNSSLVDAAASALALWLGTRRAEVEMKIETGVTSISFKSEDLSKSPDVKTELSEVLHQVARS